MNITDAKKAVKIWILDRSESWGPSTQNNKTRLQLHCILLTYSSYIRMAQKENDLFRVTSYTPHDFLLQLIRCSHFPQPRFGHDTSNIVESTNSVPREIQDVVWCSSIRGFHEMDANMPNWTSNSYTITN
jgi:hypothetical protein